MLKAKWPLLLGITLLTICNGYLIFTKNTVLAPNPIIEKKVESVQKTISSTPDVIIQKPSAKIITANSHSIAKQYMAEDKPILCWVGIYPTDSAELLQLFQDLSDITHVYMEKYGYWDENGNRLVFQGKNRKMWFIKPTSVNSNSAQMIRHKWAEN